MLRTRLFLNLIPFVVILMAVGIYAVLLFSQMATTVDTSVMQSYRSVDACYQMREALYPGMETGLRTALGGVRQNAAGISIFTEKARLFDEALAVQIKNADLPGEAELTDQLRTNYLAFRSAAQAMLASTTPHEQEQIYQGNVISRMITLHQTLGEIRQLNHQDILATTRNIGAINTRISNLMAIGMAIALIISLYACYQLGKSLLQPIQQITRAARAIGEGNLDQTVPVLSKDELGELAIEFNKMAGQLKAYQQSTTDKIVRLHRTMESTLASFPDPIFVLDQAGHIELKNPAAEDFCSGLGLKDTLPDRLQETAGEVMRTENDFLPHSFTEAFSLRLNGAEKCFLPRILNMRDDNGKLVGVAVVLYDVTRFRLLDDAKSNLVATVSHELKSPLTSVRMVLHLLLERTLGPLTPKQDEMLETARTDAERLLRILNDLLDLTRLESGNSDIKKEVVAPHELIREAVQSIHRRVAEAELKLTSASEPELPPVLADRQRILHVFENFITNAIKHSPPGGEIRIHAARTEDGDIQFGVLDQGSGILEEHQGRVFDRFYRVPGQDRAGVGLGLSIAREIVVAHGGRIGVRSQPGKGSEFYFVLSAAEELPAKETKRPAEARV